MEHKIHGTTLPVLEMTLSPGEMVFSESGELSWLSASIQMKTGASVGGQSGGFFGALKRAVANTQNALDRARLEAMLYVARGRADSQPPPAAPPPSHPAT